MRVFLAVLFFFASKIKIIKFFLVRYNIYPYICKIKLKNRKMKIIITIIIWEIVRWMVVAMWYKFINKQ